MITTDFTGSFGNHMFQYVGTRIIADKKGYEYGFIGNRIYGDYHGGKLLFDFLNLDYGKSIEGLSLEEYKEKVVSVEGTNIHKFHSFCDLGDNHRLFGNWQCEGYYRKRKEDIRKWLEIKPENALEYYNTLAQLNIQLDENTCVLNIRGGQYKAHPTLILPKQYWENAMFLMKRRNPAMRFFVVTDDVEYCHQMLPNIPTAHFSIGMDYFMVNQAQWLILSNSSFAWFPAYLNTKVNEVIAPKYWAGHNTSNGIWANALIQVPEWKYMDRAGNLQTYSQVIDELRLSKYWQYYHENS